jgi:tRNA modification GTPase
MYPLDDTIAAIASAAGGAARGIVRLSGPRTLKILESCFACDDPNSSWYPLPRPRVFSGRFHTNALTLPADLFLWPQGRSYTRQLLAEIHTFGSPPLVDEILQTLCRNGARLAQPGEFTLRAFLAGRIDLTQAEAVLGVIDAANRNQLQVALAQLAGGLARPLGQLRSDLLDLLADLEAGLDFVEDDIRFVTPDELNRRLAAAAETIDQIAAQLAGRDAVTARPRVVLIGYPNVGKSSLFNSLVGNAAALVSTQAGTTRDYLSATIDARGMSIELIDTAGIWGDRSNGSGPRDENSIDDLAQEISSAQFVQADLRLLCIDSTRPLNGWERLQLTTLQTLPILTKCDQARLCELLPGETVTSSLVMTGMEELLRAIHDCLASSPGERLAVAGTAARARESIRTASVCLAEARRLVESDYGDELVATEIRSALLELGKIVGAVYTDDLLDRIFSRFCIGK